jgi:hypothetical protein
MTPPDGVPLAGSRKVAATTRLNRPVITAASTAVALSLPALFALIWEVDNGWVITLEMNVTLGLCPTHPIAVLAVAVADTLPLVCVIGLSFGWLATFLRRPKTASIGLVATWPWVFATLFFLTIGSHLLGPATHC